MHARQADPSNGRANDAKGGYAGLSMLVARSCGASSTRHRDVVTLMCVTNDGWRYALRGGSLVSMPRPPLMKRTRRVVRGKSES